MVAFEIKDKVALISGGASGMGFSFALALLERGAKGVTLADINSKLGIEAVKEIETKYGKNKAIFVKTDVASYEQFEDAFKETVTTFKNVDILINNAAIASDKMFAKEISVNLNGTIHGILLGLEAYLPKYKSGSEGLIVNISSLGGIEPLAHLPVYTGTKFAVHGMTLSWGNLAHYNRTKVRVVGVCPGGTITPLLENMECVGPEYTNIIKDLVYPKQTPEQAATNVMQIIEKAGNGTMWVVDEGKPAYQYQMPNRSEIPKVYL